MSDDTTPGGTLRPYGPCAEWPFYLEAKETLREIEGLPGRDGQNGLIAAWSYDPESLVSRRFFDYAVTKPVSLLANVGAAVLKVDLEMGEDLCVDGV